MNLLLLDATGPPAALPSTRQGMHPLVQLETSTLRRMRLVQYSSCYRVSPELSASPDLDAIELEAADCSLSTGLSVLSRSTSTFLSVSLSFSKRSTNKLIFLQSREKRVDFLSTRTGRLFFHNGSPRSINWMRVWLGWLVDFCLSSNLHPIMSQGNLRRQSR